MSKFVHEGQEKKAYVKSMFNDISYRYDLFNTLSSFGIDRYWRYRLIKKFNLNTSDKLLDIATGTGDVIFSMHKRFSNELVGLDIAEKMIDFANKKKEKKGLHLENITFIQGDAEDLGFSDNSFNALTISFGFRNLGNYDKGLSEFFRVSTPLLPRVVVQRFLGLPKYKPPVNSLKTIMSTPESISGLSGLAFIREGYTFTGLKLANSPRDLRIDRIPSSGRVFIEG